MTKLNSKKLLLTGIVEVEGHSTITFVSFTSRNKASLKKL